MTTELDLNFNALKKSLNSKMLELAELEEELHLRIADVERREKALKKLGRTVTGEREYGSLLGLKGQVSVSEIKTAYRKLASALHPDKHSHSDPIIKFVAEEHLKSVNDAYTYFRIKYKF